ncbi:MAG TPA: class I SAM-dependent methyltransferase [Verrucomicrobiae bacterium]|jgi:2-polyprenyl-3-methyl-5-hydroxy-6-metoxy-1,4-benzoquinol methylase
MPDNITLIRQTFEQPQKYLTETRYNIRLRAETISEFLKSDNVGSILDIGCGDGSLSRGLINANNRLTLVDASQTMLKIASSHVPEEMSWRVQTINSDFMGASLEPQSFNLIICVGVLAYVEDRKAFIARIKSLLKPGGVVIVECSDGAHWLSHVVAAYQAFRRWLKPVQMQTILRSSSEVTAIFDDIGFKLAGSFLYSLPLPIMRKLMSQKFSYSALRFLFGSATHNRNTWLGNECMYCYRSPSQ